ncbi:MAG: hypothetical protein WCO02_06445 [Bacteroidota bacterium]
MMHKISQAFVDCDCFFSPFFATGFVGVLAQKNFLNFTILGGRFREQTENYLSANKLSTDFKGMNNFYDLVFTCQDILVPDTVKGRKLVLIQEGMTEPENFVYHLVRTLSLPRWLAGTSTTGLSHAYNLFFVASEGYRELFIRKGVDPEKIRVTGIPNFDHASQHLKNDFPLRNYVLAATSDRRETLNYENRKKFIKKVLKIANGRQVIFKLHPNENWDRAKHEIYRQAPDSLVFTDADINPLIANCDVLITVYSSVVYIGMALGKEVHSDFCMEMLKKLTPIQNGGTSAKEIARITRHTLLSNRN